MAKGILLSILSVTLLVFLPALGIHEYGNLSWPQSFAVPIIAVLVNGIIIAFEDDFPEESTSNLSIVDEYLKVRPSIYIPVFILLVWLLYMYINK